MKNSKIFLLVLFTIACITTINFVGCKQNTIEPIINNNTNILKDVLGKVADIDINKKKELRLKFIKEITDAKIRIKAKYNKLRKNNQHQVNALPIAEQEALEYTATITPSAHSYIYSSYGIDLHDYFSADDTHIAAVGVAVAGLETDAHDNIFYELDGEPLYEMSVNQATLSKTSNSFNRNNIFARPRLVDCFWDAYGIPISFAMGATAPNITVKAVLKVIGKMAGTLIGGAYLAYCTWEFLDCMDWL